MARNYAALFHEYGEEMQELTDEEFGRLCRALIEYSANGTPITPTGNERFYARRVMAQEDRIQALYNDAAKARSEAARLAAEKRWHTDVCECMPTHSNAYEDMPNDAKNAISISKSISKSKSKSISPNGDIYSTKFVPPTLDEVVAYAMERNSPVDPAKFFEYYQTGNWKDSKGQPVRNWKQRLLTWEKHDTPKQTKQAPKVYRGEDFFDD